MNAKIIAALLVTMGAGGILTPTLAATVRVALDVSSSTPLTTNAVYAVSAAGYVHRILTRLQFGDVVVLETFGSFGMVGQKKIEVELGRRYRPDAVADMVSQIITALPGAESIEAQQSTNILGYFETTAHAINCATEHVQFLVLTDGWEASVYVDPAQLAEGKTPLPPPADSILAGCDVEMIGIGQFAGGGNPRVTQNLIAAWDVWFAAAGAIFKPLPTF